ncbi:MAG: 4'-phosphopantetheinyl transferase superfamily protein [bacterium]
MFFTIGCDIAKVDRFKDWPNFSKNRLLKIYSEQELQYCFSDQNLILQRLAVCFSVKESFFKAFSSFLVKSNKTKNEFSFMFACKLIEFTKTTWDVPTLKVDWKSFEQKIEDKLPEIFVDVSISHESDYVFTTVILHE